MDFFLGGNFIIFKGGVGSDIDDYFYIRLVCDGYVYSGDNNFYFVYLFIMNLVVVLLVIFLIIGGV